MTESPKKPAVYYVVFCVLKYKSFEEAKTTAPDDIASHLKRSNELHEQGSLLMSGLFLDSEDGHYTMAVLNSRQAAEDYIKGDPFYAKGMMKKWFIREWANMFA